MPGTTHTTKNAAEVLQDAEKMQGTDLFGRGKQRLLVDRQRFAQGQRQWLRAVAAAA